MTRALLLCVGLAAALAAQSPTPLLHGVLRDPSGAAVAGAEVQFLADPVPELPALAGMLPAPACRTACSDAQGRFDLAGLEGAGTLLATTAKGLGAFAARCRPGEPVFLQLQPMAEVGAPGRSEVLTLWAAAIGADGGRRSLPPLHGSALRLPAGNYEAWYRLGDSLHWARLQLHSGTRQDLQFRASALQLQRRAGVSVQPADWPQVELFPDAASCRLCGDAALAAFVTRIADTGLVIPSRQLLHAATATQSWPPPELLPVAVMTLQIEVGDRAAAGAAAWLLRQQPGTDGWQPLGLATADAAGKLSLPLPAAVADCWLLVTAPGCAPSGFAVPALAAPAVVRLQPRRRLDVTLTAAGDVGDVCVEFEPADAGVAMQRSHSDALGHARFDVAAHGGGTLRVSDGRFANAAVAIAGGDERVRLQLQPGAVLEGRTVVAGDLPAAQTVVTLRDPRGRLRPAARTVITDADGNFRFTGLDAADDLVLFAHQRRLDRTWSGTLAPARADGSRYVLELRCEDPELPRGGDR